MPEEDLNMYDIKLLRSHSSESDASIIDIAKRFANITKACENKNCILEQNLGIRAETFRHKFDDETGDLTFYGLSQKYETKNNKQSVNIVLTDYTYSKDGTLTSRKTKKVIKGGSKPQVYSTGPNKKDPILIIYEAPAKHGTGNQLYVN